MLLYLPCYLIIRQDQQHSLVMVYAKWIAAILNKQAKRQLPTDLVELLANRKLRSLRAQKLVVDTS